MPELAECGSCGAAILWVRAAATGALMPLDAGHVKGGSIALIDGMAHILKGDLFEPMLPAGPRYRSHFATCPSAQKYRKARNA